MENKITTNGKQVEQMTEEDVRKAVNALKGRMDGLLNEINELLRFNNVEPFPVFLTGESASNVSMFRETDNSCLDCYLDDTNKIMRFVIKEFACGRSDDKSRKEEIDILEILHRIYEFMESFREIL